MWPELFTKDSDFFGKRTQYLMPKISQGIAEGTNRTHYTDLKCKLTSYHSKPPNLYGLAKIHKPDISMRSVVSVIKLKLYLCLIMYNVMKIQRYGNVASHILNFSVRRK
jgi:hypothetical protein